MDESQFFGRNPAVPFGAAVERDPDQCEGKAQSAGVEKGGLPAEAVREPRNDEGRGDGRHVGAGVNEAEGEGALAAREPFGADLGGAGERGRLSDTEGGAIGREGKRPGAERGKHGARRPRDEREPVAEARADAIEKSSRENLPDGVGDGKRGPDVAVLGIGNGELGLEVRRENGENEAIDVVDGDGEEEKREDDPAEWEMKAAFLRREFHRNPFAGETCRAI